MNGEGEMEQWKGEMKMKDDLLFMEDGEKSKPVKIMLIDAGFTDEQALVLTRLFSIC